MGHLDSTEAATMQAPLQLLAFQYYVRPKAMGSLSNKGNGGTNRFQFYIIIVPVTPSRTKSGHVRSLSDIVVTASGQVILKALSS